MNSVLEDICDTMEALTSGRENEFTEKLKKSSTYELLYSRYHTEKQFKEYIANRPKDDNTEIELIIDFYHRFIQRMENMMKVGKENGYDLISFMGP